MVRQIGNHRRIMNFSYPAPVRAASTELRDEQEHTCRIVLITFIKQYLIAIPFEHLSDFYCYYHHALEPFQDSCFGQSVVCVHTLSKYHH